MRGYDSRGLTHGDIKPDNLMITATGRVKLCDLGVAERSYILQKLAGGPRRAGTPLYTSPEVIRKSPEVDIRMDLYSLGATFFHLLAGHPPFGGKTIDEVHRAHLTRPVPRIDGVSDRTQAVVERLLAKNPADRYHFPFELERDCQSLLDGEEPVHALVEREEDTFGPAVVPAGPRDPRWVGLAAILVVAVVLAILLTRPREEKLTDPTRETVATGAEGGEAPVGSVEENPVELGAGPGETSSPDPTPESDGSERSIELVDHDIEPESRSPISAKSIPPDPLEMAPAALLTPEERAGIRARRAPATAFLSSLIFSEVIEVPDSLDTVVLVNDCSVTQGRDWLGGPGWPRAEDSILRGRLGTWERGLTSRITFDPGDWSFECEILIESSEATVILEAGGYQAFVSLPNRAVEIRPRPVSSGDSTAALPVSRVLRSGVGIPSGEPIRLLFLRRGEWLSVRLGKGGGEPERWVEARAPVVDAEWRARIRTDREGLEVYGTRITAGISRDWSAKENASSEKDDRVLAAAEDGDWAQTLFPNASRTRGKPDGRIELRYDFDDAAERDDWRDVSGGEEFWTVRDGRLRLVRAIRAGDPRQPWEFSFAAIALAGRFREVFSVEYRAFSPDTPDSDPFAVGHFFEVERTDVALRWNRSWFTWLSAGLAEIPSQVGRGPDSAVVQSDFELKRRDLGWQIQYSERERSGNRGFVVKVNGREELRGVRTDGQAPGAFGICAAGTPLDVDELRIEGVVDPEWSRVEFERRLDQLRRDRALATRGEFSLSLGPALAAWSVEGDWQFDPAKNRVSIVPPPVSEFRWRFGALAYREWQQLATAWPRRYLQAELRAESTATRAGFVVAYEGAGLPCVFVGRIGAQEFGAALIPRLGTLADGEDLLGEILARGPVSVAATRWSQWRLEEQGRRVRLFIEESPVLEFDLPDSIRERQGAAGFILTRGGGGVSVRSIRAGPR